MNRAGLAYFLCAIYYCLWRSFLFKGKIYDKVFLDTLRFIQCHFVSERWKVKISQYLYKYRSSQDFLNNDRNGLFLSHAKVIFRDVYQIYPFSMGIIVSSITLIFYRGSFMSSMLIWVPVALIFMVIGSRYISKLIFENNLYLKYVKIFPQKSKAWHRRWNLITILFCVGALLSLIISGFVVACCYFYFNWGFNLLFDTPATQQIVW